MKTRWCNFIITVLCMSLYRYDVRNRLDDKSQFGLKPNFPHRMSAKEAELEEELDRERYLALEWDDIRVEEQEGGLVGSVLCYVC